MKERRRILIFNVNWLGDVLFSTAAIRNVRRNFPESFIACSIPGRCYQILEGNPYLDEIIIFDERTSHRSLKSKLAFIRFLRSKQFDTVILLHRSFSRTFLCRLAGIPERVGHYTRKRSLLLTTKVPAVDRHTLHRIDYYLHIIKGAGFTVQDKHLDLAVSPRDIHFVEDFLNGHCIEPQDSLVVLNPGGNWLSKRWPKEKWAELADRLIGELRVPVVFTGAEKDSALVSQITSLMRHEPVSSCGVFNLKQLAALAARADMFVTADTGPLHIASAMRSKRICALFGPTSAALTGPYPAENAVIIQKDVGCLIPCYLDRCKDQRCMQAISASEVFDAVKEGLAAESARGAS